MPAVARLIAPSTSQRETPPPDYALVGRSESVE